LVHRFPRVFRVLLASFWLVHYFIRRVSRTILNMHKIVRGARRTKRMVTNVNRWCSALDKRVTNDDEQQRTNHFSVRSSCVLYASIRCDRVFRLLWVLRRLKLNGCFHLVNTNSRRHFNVNQQMAPPSRLLPRRNATTRRKQNGSFLADC